MISTRTLAVAALAALLAGCGGGAGGGIAAPGTGGNAKDTAAKFTIVVPPKTTTSSTVRAPKYISPSTQSVAIAVDSSTSPTVVNLTPSSPSCSGTGSGLTCTATVYVTAGSHAFAVTTYDATNAGGNKLSTNTITQTITFGVTTGISIALGGIPASLAISLNPTNPPTGTTTTVAVTVTAKDADANIIIGSDPYANAITLADSDTSGATHLSTTSVTSPAMTVTLSYNGSSSLTSATISASATGVAGTASTPATLKPVSAGSGGSEAIAVYTAGGNTYAMVPSPTGVEQVEVASGSTLQSTTRVAATGVQTRALPRLANGRVNQAAVKRMPRAKRRPQAGGSGITFPGFASVGGADECSLNVAGLTVYCINYSSNIVAVGNLSTLTETAEYTTDAGTNGVSFSGGSCVICGIAYDTIDSAFLISTSNGFEVYNATSGAKIKTIAEYVAENFGYNPVTDLIFSPQYGTKPQSMDAINVSTGVDYAYSNLPVALDFPDSAAIDPITNVGISPEEFVGDAGASSTQETLYLVNFGAATYNTPAGTPATYSAPITTANLTSVDYAGSGIFISDAALDPGSHLAFFAGEFTGPGVIGAGQLPTTAPTGAPAMGDYVFAALPSTPDSNEFDIPGDPHATATFPFGSSVLGFTFNEEGTYLAVIDLVKLMAAPRDTTTPDPHAVSPTYDLVANGVVTYIAL
jgi:hypothetical protein